RTNPDRDDLAGQPRLVETDQGIDKERHRDEERGVVSPDRQPEQKSEGNHPASRSPLDRGLELTQGRDAEHEHQAVAADFARERQESRRQSQDEERYPGRGLSAEPAGPTVRDQE